MGNARSFTAKVWEEFGVEPPADPVIASGDNSSNSTNPEVKEFYDLDHSRKVNTFPEEKFKRFE